MLTKKQTRVRRAQKTRHHQKRMEAVRLCVNRSTQHIYAQIIDSVKGTTLASASSLEADVRGKLKNGGNVEAAKIIGKRIADKAKAAGIDTVAFDRSGFKYHGRVKALADAARENGLKI